jgi:hypothetical protein
MFYHGLLIWDHRHIGLDWDTQLEVKAKNPLISAHYALLALFSSVFSARSAFFAYF